MRILSHDQSNFIPGGTGKTISAINIATALKETFQDVVLIETDPNYSLRDLRQREALETDLLPASLPDLVLTQTEAAVSVIKAFALNAKAFVFNF